MTRQARAPIKGKSLLLVLVVLGSMFSGSFYMMIPVRARVFSMDLPNVDLGVLELKVVGEYEIHLDDLNLSGFFKVGNETVRYYLEILSADIVYQASLIPESTNLTVRYDMDYQGLNFTVASKSFALIIDYVQLSTKGELVITLTGKNTFNLSIYEMVPRFSVERAQWPSLEFIKNIGAST
jgi:hypothetical protein